MRPSLRLGVLCWLALTAWLGAQDVAIGQREVRLALIRNDGTRLDWPREAGDARSQIATVRHVVREADTIHALLINGGIRPDVEAFSLVYSLNPALETLEELPGGAALTLPAMRAGEWLKSQLGAGHRVLLTTDPKPKEAFDRNVRSLTAIGTARLEKAVAKPAAVKSITNVVETMEFIRLTILRRNGRPLSTETIEQLSAEAELLRSILEPIAAARATFTAEAAERITAIEKDIEVKKARFVQTAAGGPPEAWPRVNVVVRTVKNGQPVPNLRVHYVPQALAGYPERIRAFDTLTSPAERALPEADYVVWASAEGQTTPISNEHKLEVRKGRAITVDLTVLR